MILSNNSEFVAPVVTDDPTLAGAAICIDCSGPLGARNKTGRCKPCCIKWLADVRRLPQNYCGCGAKIRNHSERCPPCNRVWMNESTDIKAARAEGIRRKFQDPEHRAKMAKVARRNSTKYYSDPAAIERARENGKRLYREFLNTPESRAKCNAAIRASAWKATEKYLGWCPPEHRDEYRRLQKRLKSSVKAREEIERVVAEEKAIKHPFFEDVLHFMRRLTAIVRLDNGNYRVGTAELTPGELLKRAERKGYSYERLAA
jgi:hypothetical protein